MYQDFRKLQRPDGMWQGQSLCKEILVSQLHEVMEVNPRLGWNGDLQDFVFGLQSLTLALIGSLLALPQFLPFRMEMCGAGEMA